MKETLVKDCECWEYSASLDFVDRRVNKDAIRHIYCPVCSKGIRKDVTRMVESNGWLFEYEPNLLRSASSAIRLIQNRKVNGSFLVYTERKNILENDI